MKKFILLVFFYLLFFLFPPLIDAQNSIDCWPTHMIRQYSKCSPPHTECLQKCSVLDTTPERKVCFEECGRVNKLCTDKAVADYKACVAEQTGQSSDVPTSTPKTTIPVKDEQFILKFLGINPFEVWLRILTWSRAPELLLWLPEMSATEILDLDYQDGMIRVEIDSSSVFPANPEMAALKDTSGAQIRIRGQSEYQNLKPNQDIPDGASIKINKPTRFDIGAGDDYIEVQPAGQTGWAEFQIQKSEENESVDIIEAIDSKVKVRLGAGIDRQILSEITDKVVTDAWKMPAPTGEKLMDVPGVENTKKYSWDDSSEAVIKSNDWEKIEFKDSTVKLKEGEMEVKVRNDNPSENKFKVDADGFFDLVVVQTHFFVSYNPKTKKGEVIVYEGEVEIRTKDGKVIKVKPDGDKSGVVVMTQKLSPVKLGLAGIVMVAIISGAIFILKRKKILLSIILLLTVAVFLSPKADAKTRQECEKTRDRASYNCLLGFGKCYSSCVTETKNNMGCRDLCKQAENACDKEVDTQYKICLETLPKTKENTPTQKIEQVEAETNPSCHEVFTNESNSCLKESTKCINSCVEKGNAAMSLTVDGAKVSLECQKSVCEPASEACNNKAMANFRVCGKADKQQDTAKASKQESNWLEFLGINPYQTWLRLKELAEVAEVYTSGELEESLEGGFLNLFGAKSTRQKDQEATKRQEAAYEAAFGKDWREQLHQLNQPKIDTKVETDAWSVPTPKVESVIYVPWTTDTKRYSWDENSGVVVKSNDWENVKFKEPVEVGGSIFHTLELGTGEVEVRVRNNNIDKNQFGVDAGWLGVTVSRTHFWVSKSQDKKVAIVGVYEGEVEVKTKDGKTMKVKPDEGKPGVVVVSKKLSPVKLGIAGLVVAAVIGGAVLILRKKFASKGLSKKER